MISLKPRSIFPFLIKDIIAFCFALIISLYFFTEATFARYEKYVVVGLVIGLFVFELVRKIDSAYINLSFRRRFLNDLKVYLVFTAIVMVSYVFMPAHLHHRGRFLIMLTVFCCLDFVLNYFFVQFMGHIKPIEALQKKILIAGTGRAAKNVEKQLMSGSKGKSVLKGFICCHDEDDTLVEDERILGNLETISEYLDNNTVDEIVIAMHTNRKAEIQSVVELADYHGIRVKFVLDYHEIFGNKYRITKYGTIDALNIRELPIDNKVSAFIKNAFDLVFAFVILLALAPLFFFIALIIKLDSPGPVFYFPIRIGRGGKPFKVFKFRSMRVNDVSTDGKLSTIKDDPRVTRVGKYLRKYSLDELPQFINVLLGDMSVVGPRPHRKFLNKKLQESVGKYMVRHYVKPGITGWAQVNGWRGPTDTDEQKQQRTSHDLWYVENWSFLLDLKIIFKTIFGKNTRTGAF